MASTPQPPPKPAAPQPVALTPEQRTALVTEPHPPQKYRRPLPQPGDNDYVAGQPVNEEEAARVEAEDEERYARAQAAAQEAIARRQDVRTDEQEGDREHPGSRRRPDNDEPLHKPGAHAENKDR
jgi:hypothetical protein